MPPRRTKGEGSLYRRTSGQWVYSRDLGLVGGRRVRKTVTARSLTELRPKMRKLDASIDGGIIPERATVAEWLDYWLDHIVKPKGRGHTHVTYATVVRLHISPIIGHHQLQKLRPEHVRAMHEELARLGRTPGTVGRANDVLRSALRAAMNDQRVPINAAAIAGPPRAEKGHHASLSLEQAHQVLAAATCSRDQLRLSLALILGLRRGEALGLEWADMHEDDDQPHLSIERQWTHLGTIAEPKSDRSKRVVPLPPAVATLARAWRQESGGQVWVFPNVSGERPVATTDDYKRWTQALKRAGVPHVPLHGARSTAATWMRAQGTPEHIIASILGQVRMVSAYLHHDPGQQMKALDALSSAMLAKD